MNDDVPSSEDIERFRSVYARVGEIASLWSVLEFVIDKEIWDLAGLDEQSGACITTQIQSAQYRMNALASLVNLQFGEGEITRLVKALTDKICKTALKRNRAVHNPVVSHSSEGMGRINIIAKHKLSYGVIPYSEPDFQLLANEIASLIMELQGLATKVTHARDAMREDCNALIKANTSVADLS